MTTGDKKKRLRKSKQKENMSTFIRLIIWPPAALIHHQLKPKSPSETNLETSLGIKLLFKLSQEMVEQANYLTGNILHFRARLWGALQRAECLKTERDTVVEG